MRDALSHLFSASARDGSKCVDHHKQRMHEPGVGCRGTEPQDERAQAARRFAFNRWLVWTFVQALGQHDG